MIFEQLFDKTSSTYTYLISSGRGREALIIDPVLEHVNKYLEMLEKLNLKLVKVIDTHIHADHITGMSELKTKTNCETVMGDRTPADIVSIKVKDQENITLDNFKKDDGTYNYVLNTLIKDQGFIFFALKKYILPYIKSEKTSLEHNSNQHSNLYRSIQL